MISQPYDREGAEHLFVHCLAASQKFSHREMSKQELVSKLKKLAQFSVDRSFRQHLAELEDRINDVIKKERRILTVTARERDVEKSIQEKINALEEKVSHYIEQKAVHEVKIKELETKVRARMQRRQMIHELKNHISAVEEMYDEIVQTRYLYDPAKIRRVEAKLAALKERLAELEHKKD